MKSLLPAGILISSFVFINQAEAANLTGPGLLNINGAVTMKQTVLNNNGTPLNLLDDITKTSFDFLPSVAGTVSSTTIPFGGATGGFSGFAGTNPVNLFQNTKSLIKDTEVDASLSSPFIAAAIPNFIELKDELGVGTGTTFTLERVELPTYSTSGNGASALTTARLNVYGTWFDALSGKKYTGEGVFSATFVAPSETVVLQRLRAGTGVTTAYAGTIEAIEEIKEVPEPNSVYGFVGLTGIVTLIGLKKAKTVQ